MFTHTAQQYFSLKYDAFVFHGYRLSKFKCRQFLSKIRYNVVNQGAKLFS